MEQNIEIKAVRITEHYEIISKMMHELHLNEHSLFNKTASWQDIDTNYMRHIIKMQEEQEGLFLIAYKEGNAVGFIFGYIEEQDDSRIEIYEGKELYVSDGYVAKEHRRNGIYTKLNTILEHHYKSMGVKRMVRFTLINNTGMRQFLEGNGYNITRLMYEKWL